MKVKRKILSIVICLSTLISTFAMMPVVAGAAETNDITQMSVEEQYDYIMGLETDEDIESEISKLSQEQYDALEAYATEKAQEEADQTQIETINFTDAGPFMPAVNVTGASYRSKMLKSASLVTRAAYQANNSAVTPLDEGDTTESNGLELSKKSVPNGDGSYTITMEAYTTGTVTTTTKPVPVDIVLVLDQSGSMAYDFNGNSTNTKTDRRQYAMKQAVNTFISSVSKKYSDEADHRIALVTFGSGASTLQGWTLVDENGESTLQGKINNLPDLPSGATNVAAGMSQAETLMGTGYNYSGDNTTRQKVVIVFTDGVPTTSTDFDTTVATNAIYSAKKLKDSGCTVYSVGIFNGADPEQLYGDSGFDRNSNGTIGSDWSNFSIWNIGDIKSYDIPAGNRFLNYLSSNFLKTDEIGIENFSMKFIGIGYTGWEITKNFDRDNNNYYLTASDATSLNNIFKTISENIQTANIDLGSETVIKDIVTTYFNMPENASDIKLYTANAKGDGTFEDRVDVNEGDNITATIKSDDNAVLVSGFDFNQNFVSETAKSDGTYGKKLIIEFDVSPKAGFLGGNNVPTNVTGSGVYSNDGILVENFDVPEVNVPIEDVKVTASDKNVYLLEDLTADQLKAGADIVVGGTEVDGVIEGGVILDLAEMNYGLKTWQNDYVDIAVEIKDAEGKTISDLSDLSDLTDDTTYTISVKFTPKKDGKDASGTVATEKTGDDEATINVFKPVVPFKDSEVDYGGDAPESYGSNIGNIQWKHGNTDSTDESIEMIGTAPTIDLTYTIGGGVDNNKVITLDDIPVNVEAKIGSQQLQANDDITFSHTFTIKDNCGFDSTSEEFLLHVKSYELVIKKSGLEATDENQTCMFDVVGSNTAVPVNLTVAINGNGSAVIKNMPVGAFRVTEQTDWSWRYESAGNNTAATISKENQNPEVSFVNSRKMTKWLNGNAYNENAFGKFSEVVTD